MCFSTSPAKYTHPIPQTPKMHFSKNVLAVTVALATGTFASPQGGYGGHTTKKSGATSVEGSYEIATTKSVMGGGGGGYTPPPAEYTAPPATYVQPTVPAAAVTTKRLHPGKYSANHKIKHDIVGDKSPDELLVIICEIFEFYIAKAAKQGTQATLPDTCQGVAPSGATGTQLATATIPSIPAVSSGGNYAVHTTAPAAGVTTHPVSGAYGAHTTSKATGSY